MCGITGWVDWDQDLAYKRTVLKTMSDTLANRGPDASGMWVSINAAFAHRRLIVVDPAGGAQPMVRSRGENQYVITYNGELYNTPDLRRELELKGYSFSGHSDTEVLLVSYIEWGESCVNKLNGIYAFGIWNEKEQRLFLARDRIGVKPLFYTHRHNSLIFASELKALLAHPEIRPELDAEGLAEALFMSPGRTPGHGVFKGISELKPAHCLVYDHNGLKIWPYWKLASRPHEDDFSATVKKVRELFKDTVIRQLVADVPVCTLLSGGIDSSAITAYAVEGFNNEGIASLHSWSVDYLDNDRNFKPTLYQPDSDMHWVQLVSNYLGTVHHNVLLDTPELVDALSAAVRARDLPGMADVDSSLYLFSRAIKQEATVALSGECADEIFGGYPWFNRPELVALNTFPWLGNLNLRVSLISPEIIEIAKPKEYIDRRYRETLDEVPRLPGEDAQNERIREIGYLTMHWFMQTLLDRKDRMSMAVGLEMRVPFCDHRLVEYVWNIPWSMKSCDQVEKGILRRALKGVLPENVLTRKKSPYPKTHNPNYLRAVRSAVLEILEDHDSPLRKLINIETLRKLAACEEKNLNQPFYGQLMTDAQLFAYLIQVDTWLREYKVSIV